METSVMHQDVSRCIPIGLDESENPLESVPSYSLLPELKSDEEIENVLHKISELLTSTSPTRTVDINDSRSISEILKEAEELVKDSSGYFEAISIGINRVGGSGGSEVGDNTDCSQELERDSPVGAETSSNTVDDTTAIQETGKDPLVERSAVNISFLPIIKPESVLTPPSLRTPIASPRKRPPPTSLSLRKVSPAEVPTEFPPPEALPPEQKSKESVSKSPPPPPLVVESDGSQSTPSVKASSNVTSEEEAVSGRQASTPKRGPQASVRSTPAQSPIRSHPVWNPTPSSSTPDWDFRWKSQATSREVEQDCTLQNQSQDKMSEFEEIQKDYDEKIMLLQEFDKIKKRYEENIAQLQEEVDTYRKKVQATEEAAEATARLVELEQQLATRDSLLTACRDESATVRAEAAKARYEEKKIVLLKLLEESELNVTKTKCWSEAERKLGDKIRKLEGDLRRANTLNTTEIFELREQLADAREQITSLEEENHLLKIEKRELEARLAEAEREVRSSAVEIAKAKEAKLSAEQSLAAARAEERVKSEEKARDEELANASLRTRLSNATSQLAAKQTEVTKLSSELGRVRGELERARLGSVLGMSTTTPSAQVRQLEAQVDRQRATAAAANQQAAELNRRNADLQRQVKELESIVKRRNRGSSGVPWATDAVNGNSPPPNGIPANGNPGEPTANANNAKTEALEHRNRQLEELLETKEKLLSDCTQKLSDLQGKGNVGASRSSSSVSLARRHPPGNARSTQSASQPAQDTHLVATIRGLRADLAARDKQVARLQKELEDIKKKKPITPFSKLQRQQNSNKGERSPSSISGSTNSPLSKSYNPFLYEEDQEAILFLRNENQNLREEVKKLEQDLITLHNKRVQDLNEMETHHCKELDKIRSDISNSAQTRLKGQIYTQQMVINHLKSRVRQMEEQCRNAAVVEAERDELRASLSSLSTTNSRGTTPRDGDVVALAAKVTELERREAARRARVASLLNAAGERANSPKDCCADKNRQICFYRTELDRMLEALSQLRNG